MADSPASTPGRTGSAGPEGLRPEAAEFRPQAPRRESPVKPIRTASRQQRGDVLANLDAIPFTPSQGVCTPSPTNMASMWAMPHFFQQSAWGAMASGFVGSPSSGGSDSSMLQASGSQPGTPGGMYGGGAAMVWGGFCQPMPYSPTALQIAAASGALGSDPSTPTRGRGSPAAAAAGGAFSVPLMPGSPVVLSPGQMMFAQYFGSDGVGGARSKPSRARSHSHSPSGSKDSGGGGSGDEGEGSDGGLSSNGSGGTVEVSEAAHHIANAMCAAQQLPGEPPQQLLELASLLHAYGLVSAVPAHPPAAAAPPGGPPLSPDSKARALRARQKMAPKLNADGSVRLNARQRRTLRRAQERAMKALMDAQTKTHGISSEQAATNLASMGVASMLLGSPPPAPRPTLLASPLQMPTGAYMAAGPMAVPLSPVMLAAHHHGGHPADYGMQQAAMMQQMQQAAMMQHAAAGFDGGAAYGLPQHGGMHGEQMGMPGGAYATPPRYAGSRLGSGGFRSPGGGGPRSAPSAGRSMSRFAPPDAVAAF